MHGVIFHYYSFSRDSYGDVLGERGFTLIDVHEDSGRNSYYQARGRER